MKRNILYISIFLFFLGCDNWSGKEVVDTEYLKSSDYQSFQKKYSRERKKSIRQQKEFTEFVHAKIKQQTGTKIILPALIDGNQLEASLNADAVSRSSLTTLLGFEQVYYPIAKAEGNEMEYYFFMTCKVANYKDCLLWFASADGPDLIQIQMISTYKKTLSYTEIPSIHITQLKLSIEINRNVKYPLRSLNDFVLEYKITDSGQIFRVSES